MSKRATTKAKPSPTSADSPAPVKLCADSAAQETIELTLERCAKAVHNGKPIFNPFLMESTKWHLERAARDCRALDSHEENQDAFFLTRFLAGIQDAKSIGWIHSFVIYPTKKHIDTEAKKSPDHGKAAIALDHLRELARDQYSPSAALISIVSEIKERAEAGDTRFFEMLGKELAKMRKSPKSYLRGKEAWIRRAWLPLCLWEFWSSPNEAWPIIYRAGKLLKLDDIVDGIDRDPQQWRAFEAAWRNVKVR